jgi:hypothetical protein
LHSNRIYPQRKANHHRVEIEGPTFANVIETFKREVPLYGRAKREDREQQHYILRDLII